jgi:hypothetical protein
MKTKREKVSNRSYLAQVFSGHVLKASLQYFQRSCDKLQKKKLSNQNLKLFGEKKTILISVEKLLAYTS